MLTPVAASSDTSFSAYGQPGIVLSAQRGEVLLSSTSVDPRMLREPSVSSGSRLDLLSLSGQLQLAQGLSVVETIGALLSVSRNQGEPLTDYADRIAEVIAKLSPTERLSLQRALNQLMQGVTLRLLTEILKNPVGPDATRLALKLEAAAYLERDPVTRQVVTSYRQNAGVEAQPPASGRPAAGGAIAGASARQAAPPFDGAMGASPAETRDDAKLPLLRQNSDETEREGEAGTGGRSGAPLTLLNSRTSAQPAIPAAPAPANTPAAGADLLRQAATLSLTDPEETGLPQAVATAPETKAPAEPRPEEQDAADAALDDVTYDGPALARLVQAGGEPPIVSAATRAASASQQPVLPASASMPGAVLMTLPEPESVPVAWISGLYADEGGASWLLANAAPHAMADAADPLAARAFDGMAAGETERLGSGSGAGLGTGAASTPLPAAAAQNPSAQASAATMNPAQQAAALQALAAQGMLVRDGLMPAYVPYPAPGGIEEKPKPLVPAVEPDDEHRERRRRSGGDPGTGEDGQDEQRSAESETTMAGDGDVMQEPALFDERAAEQDIAHLATAPAIGDDAQAYYQRMAGW
jgi:hypothetical protein